MENKKYLKMDLLPGTSIEEAVEKLLKYKDKGILRSCEFNGVTLYSDTVTLNDAYLKITGETKEERDRSILKFKDVRDKSVNYELIDSYIKMAKGLVDEDKMEEWERIVPIRVSDIYGGMELRAALEIMKHLKEDNFDLAAKALKDQNHSGISYNLTLQIVNHFSIKGPDFINYVK